MEEAQTHLARIQRQIADHIALYLRDPESAHIWDSTVIGIPGPIKTLLLTTTGRVSGKDRHVALQYFKPDGLYVVVGSKAGVETHPLWYRNLIEEPLCRFRAGAFHAKAKARTAKGDERERLWSAVSTEQPEYIKYQARTDREIPVIVLETIDV